MRCTCSPLPHKTVNNTNNTIERRDLWPAERREREAVESEPPQSFPPPCRRLCPGSALVVQLHRSRTQHLVFYFFSLSFFPDFKSTKKLFFFFNIHVRISIVEILGLVLFLGWFYSCLIKCLCEIWLLHYLRLRGYGGCFLTRIIVLDYLLSICRS